MEQFVQSLALWSYFIVFVLMWLENTGLPLPSQTVALVAAALAGQGQLNIWLLGFSAFAGGFLGYTTGYWIGLYGGRTLIERYGRYLLITPKRFAYAEKAFYTHGSKAVFFGRYLPFLCMWAGNLAGIAKIEWRKFLLVNFAGTLLWACAQMTIGYIFGRSWELLNQATNNFALTIIIALVLFGGFTLLKKLIKSRQRSRSRKQTDYKEPAEL